MERALILPDMHVPFHSKQGLALVLKAAKRFKFDRLITLGDLADFFAVSFHEKTLEKRPGFGAEVRAVNGVLDQLDSLGIPKRHYIMGNHEFRFDRYLAEKAPELSDLPGMNVPELFRLKQRGWTWTPYCSDIRIGKLWLTHDEGNAGPLAPIKARETYHGNVVIGHCHAMTIGYQGNARGESHVGASFGWLGDQKSVSYLHQVKSKRWQLGFGTALIEKSGIVHLQACPIIKGKVAVFGEIVG